MTHASTEQPEPLLIAKWLRESPSEAVSWADVAARLLEEMHARIAELEASQAQRVLLSEHAQALGFLAGLHPGITIDEPPMAVAELIFDAVQADQRALKEEISKQERNLDLMRKELPKRAPTSKDCKRPECIARGCFGYCMKGIGRGKRG